MKKVAFITGGAGFIGSRLARQLTDAGCAVTVFDNLHPQVHGAGAVSPPDLGGARFIRGDVTDPASLNAAVAEARPDIVYHLAAETGTGQSFDEPARYNAVNVMGTAHLVEALRAAPARARRRVVLAGSRAVYGEGACLTAAGALVPGPVRSAAALARGAYAPGAENGVALTPAATPETLPPAPASVYASTKLMQEYLLTQCAAEGAYDPVLLRFQNVYGPGQSLNNPYTGVLSIFAAQIMDGKRLNIFEDGKIVRDFVYVDDVVEALAVAGSAPEAPQGPVNIGSGYPATILECAQTLLEALGAPRDRYDVTGDFRAGDIRHALADIDKAARALGWRPTTALTDGLRALAAWAREERRMQGGSVAS